MPLLSTKTPGTWDPARLSSHCCHQVSAAKMWCCSSTEKTKKITLPLWCLNPNTNLINTKLGMNTISCDTSNRSLSRHVNTPFLKRQNMESDSLETLSVFLHTCTTSPNATEIVWDRYFTGETGEVQTTCPGKHRQKAKANISKSLGSLNHCTSATGRRGVHLI